MESQFTLDLDLKKKQRRDVLLEKVIKNRCTNGLFTNYPGPSGQKFLHTLKAESDIKMTVTEKYSMRKENKDALTPIAKVFDHTDILDLVHTDKFDFFDFDLMGGISKKLAAAIESHRYWRVLMLTVSNKPRCKNRDYMFVPRGEVVQTYIFEWCKQNGWGCALEPIPYKRGTKGLWYYTFVITKTA